MSTKWKKVVSIIGIAAMLATNSIGVLAEEAVAGNEIGITETEDKTDDVETEDKTDDVETEDKTDDVGTEDKLDDVVSEDLETLNFVSTLSDVQENEPILALSDEDGIPTELGWDDTQIGTIKFKHNANIDANQKLNYYIELWKDGSIKLINPRSVVAIGDYCSTSVIESPFYSFYKHETLYVNEWMTESGTYKYRLKVMESNDTSKDFSEGKVSEFSSEYEYTKPDKLSIPQNVHWNNEGVLEWDAVDYAKSYAVFLLTENGEEGFVVSTGTTLDLSTYLVDDDFTYVAVVGALGEKDGYPLYSDYSEEATFKLDGDNSSVQEGMPTDLDWVREKPGTIRFKHNMTSFDEETKRVSYDVELYKDGVKLSPLNIGISVRQQDETIDFSLFASKKYNFDKKETVVDELHGIAGPGTYKVRVRFGEGNSSSDFSQGKVSDFSSELEFTGVENTLETPKNLRWSSEKKGTLEWDEVDNATFYEILIRTPKNTTERTSVFYSNSVDLSSYFTEENSDYRVVVSANSFEYDRYLFDNSDYSEEIVYNSSNVNNSSGSGSGSGGNTSSDIPMPTNLGWGTGANYGFVFFNHNFETLDNYAEYYVQLLLNDEEYIDVGKVALEYSSEKWPLLFVPHYIKANKEYDFDTKQTIYGAGIKESGKYKFRIKVKENDDTNNDFSEGKVSEFSPEYDFQMPGETLEVPQNLHWSTSKKEVLEWDSVENASSYSVKIKGKEEQYSISVSGTSVDLSEYFTEENLDYRVVVNAYSSNRSSYEASDYSEEIVYRLSSGNGANPTPKPETEQKPSSNETSNENNSATPVTVVEKNSVPSVGNSQGWSSLETEVLDSVQKSLVSGVPATVLISLNDANDIPAAAFKTLAGKDVTAVFAMKNDVLVNVDGKSFSENGIGDVSFASEDTAEGSMLMKVRNSVDAMDTSIAIFCKASVGTVEQTLYFVDADNSLIPFRNSVVAENGYVSFLVPFVNANFIIK